ncbi:sensor histidine kinase [Pacificispira sp.]|uniref:sensor histidine kinase n=1 Tax=Pacificispira sp. TaxID=2888761 RepID=UPI003BA8591F
MNQKGDDIAAQPESAQEQSPPTQRTYTLVLMGGADWAAVRAAGVSKFRTQAENWTIFVLEGWARDGLATTLARRDTAVRAERAGATVLSGDFQDLQAHIAGSNEAASHILAVHDAGILSRYQLRMLSAKLRRQFRHARVSTARLPVSLSLGLTADWDDDGGIASKLLGIAGVVAGFSAATWAINQWENIAPPSMTMLLAVLVSAVMFGRWAGIVAACLGAIVLNLVFIWPLWVFEISDARSLMTLFIFLGVGGLMSFIVGRSSDRAVAARDRQVTASLLFGAARRMAEANSEADVARALGDEFGQELGFRLTVITGADDPDRVERQLKEQGIEFMPSDLQAAAFACHTSEPTGVGTSFSDYVLNYYEPIEAGPENALLVVSGAEESTLRQSGFRVLMESLSDLIGLTLSRIRAREALHSVRLQSEAEQSRSAVLAAMSHDFRTPLSTILGTASSLQQFRATYSEETVDELLGNIVSGAERLDKFVRKILDQTRLQAKPEIDEADFVDMTDVVDTACETLNQKLMNYRVEVLAPDVVPLIRGDAALLEHLIQNLLENAMKYSKPKSAISVQFEATGQVLSVSITDQGIGLTREQCAAIFDPFYQVHAGEVRSDGIGLGLSICTEIARLHKGTLRAQSDGLGHGTTFTIDLPIENVVEIDGAGDHAQTA